MDGVTDQCLQVPLGLCVENGNIHVSNNPKNLAFICGITSMPLLWGSGQGASFGNSSCPDRISRFSLWMDANSLRSTKRIGVRGKGMFAWFSSCIGSKIRVNWIGIFNLFGDSVIGIVFSRDSADGHVQSKRMGSPVSIGWEEIELECRGEQDRFRKRTQRKKWDLIVCEWVRSITGQSSSLHVLSETASEHGEDVCQ